MNMINRLGFKPPGVDHEAHLSLVGDRRDHREVASARRNPDIVRMAGWGIAAVPGVKDMDCGETAMK